MDFDTSELTVDILETYEAILPNFLRSLRNLRNVRLDFGNFNLVLSHREKILKMIKAFYENPDINLVHIDRIQLENVGDTEVNLILSRLRLSQITYLDLGYTAVTDAIGAHLPAGLQHLDLGATSVTDAIGAHLPAGLQHLDLVGNLRVTDEIGSHLPAGLQHLDLWNTAVTDAI
ncbi:hypothetical protein MEO41_27495, partial [Dolichospermum sp. ST_sed4]|nr:hypothetical protein [Dolichospermum sp. ST_sed4]